MGIDRDVRTPGCMDASSVAAMLAAERAAYVRLASRRLPSADDAEDVVQQAMVRAAAGAQALVDPARVWPWFARILRRTIADYYRAPRRETSRDPADLEEHPQPAQASSTPCPCAVRLVDELRPAYAEVLRRVDLRGEPIEAAARGLAISPANLQVRLHRARHALRDKVRSACGVSSARPCFDCCCDHAAGSRCCGGGGVAPATQEPAGGAPCDTIGA